MLRTYLVTFLIRILRFAYKMVFRSQIYCDDCNDVIALDVRIIAASNKNLKSMVEKNLFRKDLYYRLNVIPINLPNLKERGDDVIILAEHILKALRYRMNKQKIFFDYPVLDLFKRYEWPGNIREMENST